MDIFYISQLIILFLFQIKRVDIHIPTKTDSSSMKVSKLYPKEARLRGCTYDAPLDITFGWSEDGVAQPLVKMEVGRVPIMLKVSFLFISLCLSFCF